MLTTAVVQHLDANTFSERVRGYPSELTQAVAIHLMGQRYPLPLKDFAACLAGVLEGEATDSKSEQPK